MVYRTINSNNPNNKNTIDAMMKATNAAGNMSNGMSTFCSPAGRLIHSADMYYIKITKNRNLEKD